MEKAAQVGSIPSRVPLLDVCRGNKELREEILSAVGEVFDSGYFVGGPNCKKFETAFAEMCDTRFAIGCASGSDALLLALMAVGVEPGDEVIVPSFTFFATVSAVWRLGATPVFIDIDPHTFNMDAEKLERLISPCTKAVIPVHLYGQCADMRMINTVASECGIAVIEDAAQSIGAEFDGEAAGSMGHIGCFSFYPTKNLGGLGDGGMLTTNDPGIEHRLRMLANHGMNQRYYHEAVGINSRLDAIQATALNIKLSRIDEYTRGRTKNAARYRQLITARGLSNLVTTPTQFDCRRHVWNQFTIRVGSEIRDAVRQDLADRGVGTEIYYPVPMHLQKCFKSLGYEAGSLPETERASGEVLSLPIFPELTELEQIRVIDALAESIHAQKQYRLAS